MSPSHRSSYRFWAPRLCWIAAAALVALALAGNRGADAQRTTEQFIPIGQSPGLSGVVTYLGEIVAVQSGTGTLTMRRPGDTDPVTVAITGDTRIWLDRSAIGLPNVIGEFGDLAVGAVAEIHFRDQDTRRSATWVKIQSDDPG